MRAEDWDAFADVIREHFANWDREPNAKQIDARFNTLKPYTLRQVERACGYLARKGSKFPASGGEVAKAIRDFDNETVEPSGPRRCAWKAGTLQCEYRGYGFYPVNVAEPNGARYCPDHHSCSGSAEGAAIVQQSIRNKGTRPMPDYGLARDIENFIATDAEGNLRFPRLGGKAMALRCYDGPDVQVVESLIQRHGNIDTAYGHTPSPSSPTHGRELPDGQHYANVETAFRGVA